MKPIEAGCRAVIVNSWAGNDGLVVTVICRVEDNKDGIDIINATGKRWEIDIYVPTNFAGKINHLGESQLRRIYEYDGNEKISWADMRGIWQPLKEKEVVAI